MSHSGPLLPPSVPPKSVTPVTWRPAPVGGAWCPSRLSMSGDMNHCAGFGQAMFRDFPGTQVQKEAALTWRLAVSAQGSLGHLGQVTKVHLAAMGLLPSAVCTATGQSVQLRPLAEGHSHRPDAYSLLRPWQRPALDSEAGDLVWQTGRPGGGFSASRGSTEIPSRAFPPCSLILCLYPLISY